VSAIPGSRCACRRFSISSCRFRNAAQLLGDVGMRGGDVAKRGRIALQIEQALLPALRLDVRRRNSYVRLIIVI